MSEVELRFFNREQRQLWCQEAGNIAIHGAVLLAISQIIAGYDFTAAKHIISSTQLNKHTNWTASLHQVTHTNEHSQPSEDLETLLTKSEDHGVDINRTYHLRTLRT